MSAKPKQCALSKIVIKGMTAARFQEARGVIVQVCRGLSRQQVAEARQMNFPSFEEGFIQQSVSEEAANEGSQTNVFVE